MTPRLFFRTAPPSAGAPRAFARASAGLLVLLAAAAPIRVEAQGTRWAVPTAIGFGAGAAALATAASWDLEYDEGWTRIGIGAALGTVAGAIVGSAADRTLERGEELGSAHRAAVVGGTVLAGAAVGAAASALLISGEGEGTPLGSDEWTFTLLTLAGGVAGGLYVWHERDDLHPRPVSVGPYLDEAGRPGVRVGLRF